MKQSNVSVIFQEGAVAEQILSSLPLNTYEIYLYWYFRDNGFSSFNNKTNLPILTSLLTLSSLAGTILDDALVLAFEKIKVRVLYLILSHW